MRTPPPRDDLRFSNTTGILQKKQKSMGFIGFEVGQETSAPPPKKNPGSAPEYTLFYNTRSEKNTIFVFPMVTILQWHNVSRSPFRSSFGRGLVSKLNLTFVPVQAI